jgi:two-component system CheB/CheR fusion protein
MVGAMSFLSSATGQRFQETAHEMIAARDRSVLLRIIAKRTRELTRADGITIVIRDGGDCFYADEDGIAPLWRGQRFPLQTCVSGWAMLEKQRAIIPDVMEDPRVPRAVYRPTFVRSMAMIPIGREPFAALGAYWATRTHPSQEVLDLLEAIAGIAAAVFPLVDTITGVHARSGESASARSG